MSLVYPPDSIADSPRHIFELLRPFCPKANSRYHFVVGIDQRNVICGLRKLPTKRLDDVELTARCIMVSLSECGAYAGVVATCFPSDCFERGPSLLRFHRRLNCLAKAFDIAILDHVFVGPNDFDSDHSVFVDGD